MKVTELRIGNFIYYRDKEILLEVSNLGSKGFETIGYEGTFVYGSDDIEEYNPIHLTKEWLLEYGFYENRSNNSWQLDTKYGFTIWGRIDKGFNIYDEYDNEIGNTIEYVHQLQNLYFSLIGTELVLNP